MCSENINLQNRQIEFIKSENIVRDACLFCNRDFFHPKQINQKFCSHSCATTHMNLAYGGWNGYNVKFKKKHPRLYKKQRSISAKIACNTVKRLSKSHKTCEKLKIGIWNKNNRVKGGLETLKFIRLNKPYKFLNVLFDSNEEKEVAKMLHNTLQFVPIERKNCHVKIGTKEFDFILNDIVIDYHPWDKRYTLKQYFNIRRKILDNSGYRHCKYYVFKSIDEIQKYARSDLDGDGRAK